MERKPSSSKKDHAPACLALLQEAIAESLRTAHLSAAEFFADFHQKNSNAMLPSMVDGSYLTQAEYVAIKRWAHLVRDADAGLKKTVDAESWARITRSAYVAAEQQFRATGRALEATSFGEELLRRSRAAVVEAGTELIHYVPCRLFQSPLTEIRIGKIRFIRGSMLADEVVSHNKTRPGWRDHYDTVAAAPDDATVRKQHTDATTIYDAACHPWIAVVSTRDYEPLMARRRANDAVRLTIAALALSFHPSESAKLSLAHEITRPRHMRDIFQVPGRDFLASYRSELEQLIPMPGVIEDIIQQETEFHDWVGSIIEQALTDTGVAKGLRYAWLNALYWHQMGCAEPSDARAVICFASAIESLCDGIGSKNIVDALTTLFGIESTTIVAPGLKWSLARAVQELYETGRSEAVHGGSFVMFEDFALQRDAGAAVSQAALTQFAKKLRTYEGKAAPKSGADQKKFFLKWLAASRPG